MPYILMIAGAVIWRLLFQRSGEDVPNPPVLLYEFLSQPVSTSLRLAQLSIQEVLFNLFGAWQSTMDPLQFDLADRLYRSSLAWGSAAAILAILYLLNLGKVEDHSDEPGWHRQAIVLGLLAILLGSLPGHSSSAHPWSACMEAGLAWPPCSGQACLPLACWIG
jgi:hypothetical protein